VKTASRQARREENACLRSETGFRASKKRENCLLEKRKRVPGKRKRLLERQKTDASKQKEREMLAPEAKVEFEQARVVKNACPRGKNER